MWAFCVPVYFARITPNIEEGRTIGLRFIGFRQQNENEKHMQQSHLCVFSFPIINTAGGVPKNKTQTINELLRLPVLRRH